MRINVNLNIVTREMNSDEMINSADSDDHYEIVGNARLVRASPFLTHSDRLIVQCMAKSLITCIVLMGILILGGCVYIVSKDWPYQNTGNSINWTSNELHDLD